MTIVSNTSLIAVLFVTLGCGGRALDLGDDGDTGSAVPPRAPDGSIDETVPWVIATEKWGAFAVAVDDSRVYWSFHEGNSAVRSCSIDDCVHTQTTYADSVWATSLAVSPSNLYWTGGWGVRTCPILGCRGDPLTIDLRPAQQSSILEFVLDDSYLYWTLKDATIQKCPLLGCAVDTDAELVSVLSATPTHLVADESTLYVSTQAGPVGTIVAVRKDNSAPRRIVISGLFQAAGIAVNDENVYWTDAVAGTASACPLSGCTGDPVVLATSPSPGHILVDERNAYWLTNIDPTTSLNLPGRYSELVECSLDGCGDSPKVLVTSLITTNRLAQDSRHLYWTAATNSPTVLPGSPIQLGDGSVNRIGK